MVSATISELKLLRSSFLQGRKGEECYNQMENPYMYHRPGEYVIVPNPFGEHVSSLNIEYLIWMN